MTVSKSELQTKTMASNLYPKLQNGGLLCLYGDLGSGKTIFSKALAHCFGIAELSVKSPTFTYIRKYRQNLYHIDLYRLEEVDDLLLHEIAELLDQKANIVIIEWAQKIQDYLPAKRIEVHLSYLDPSSRNIEVIEKS